VWLVRSILLFLGIVAILVFAISNVDQRASVVIFTRTYPNLHLNLVLLVAALLGAAVCFAVMIWREVGLRAMVRRMRRENMRLDDELVALRNLPLSGLQAPPERPRGQAQKR
jgi:uncharacterized integral membrane protein